MHRRLTICSLDTRHLSRLVAGLVLCASAMLSQAADRPAACAPMATSSVECRAESSNCPAGPLFDVPDFWHGLSGCLRGLRDLWGRQGGQTLVGLGTSDVPVRDVVRRQIQGELTRRTTAMFDADGRRLAADRVFDGKGRWKDAPQRLVLTNEAGQAYNAMGQSDLAYFLGQFAVLARRSDDAASREDAAMYLALARASIEVDLTPTARGGLATVSQCAGDMTCTWYHSVTRRDRPGPAGATLNQHLHVTRDLALMAVLAEKEGLPDAARYRAASLAGLAQLLVSPGLRAAASTPNLADYLPTGSASRLAFYGIGLPQGKGYYLGSQGRDCNYHLHVLDLMAAVLELHAHALDDDPRLKRAASDCKGPMANMFDAMRDRFAQRGKAAVEATGADLSCPALDQRPKLDARLVEMFATCKP